MELLSNSVNFLIQPQRTTCESFMQKHIMKVYHDCVNSVIFDGRMGITRVDATPVIDAWLISSKLFPSMNDGTPDDTLFDNSATPDFILWRARSHVPYFLKLKFLFDRQESCLWSENHEEFRPFLKTVHIWPPFDSLKFVQIISY